MNSVGIKIIAKNKRASFDFHLLRSLEAGIELQGTEVKSLRDSKASLAESHVIIKNLEAFLVNAQIAPYDFGNRQNHAQNRTRKLLLHKKEIEELHHLIKTQSATIIPLKIYFKGSKVKVEIALAKGKKLYDKREDAKKAEAKKMIQQKVKLTNAR